MITHSLLVELLVASGFVIAADMGFQSRAWIVAAALAGHGVLEALHGYVVDNASVHVWWTALCGTCDPGTAAGLGWLLARRNRWAVEPVFRLARVD